MPELAQLDYPSAKLVMEAESEIEKTFRIHACAKEPWTVAFIESIPQGGTFWDVGSCVGSYALIAASRGIQTIAVEPSAINYGTLVRNLMRNNLLEHVVVLPVALADATGLTWFDYGDPRSGGANHTIGSVRRVHFHRQLLPVWKLDDLLPALQIPAPSHMKIDVDGAEMAVLIGADGVLRGDALQQIMLEMPLTAEDALLKHLAERGWEMSERYDMRGEQKIANVCYALFTRASGA